ncbi:MAG TPA: hypothetical protein VFQ44_28090 [Streptosporangiaceae bacterium]|nr:hypothetical protein [Streptosporangiaceae bacterium]
MRRRFQLLAVLAAATATATTLGLAPAASASATATATARHASPSHHASPGHHTDHNHHAEHGLRGQNSLPQHVFAPYFETYDTADGGIAELSQQSGDKFLSLAFLQTAQPGSCVALWDGDPTQPIAPSTFGSGIAAVQASGGNVIPSFGGFTADTTGTELADSCASVPSIAKVFESLITTYHVPRIDLDVEGDSINNTAGIDRRNQAIALTEQWAKAHHDRIQFSYTLPTFPTGLTDAGVAILRNAVADHARVSTVNLLTFDYFFGTEQDMVADTETAASGLVSQLQTVYPTASPRHLWHMVGVTEMPGIDDFGPDETFSQAAASTILTWAKTMGIGTLSFWAVERDNGNCPGTKGAGNCSGLTQPTWFFSHTFQPFIGNGAGR